MKKELRVYTIDINDYESEISIESLTDAEFVEISEVQGNVFSLNGFQQSFNSNCGLSESLIIRFIEVTI